MVLRSGSVSKDEDSLSTLRAVDEELSFDKSVTQCLIFDAEHTSLQRWDSISFEISSLQINGIKEKVKDINKYVKEIENYVQQGKADYKKVT